MRTAKTLSPVTTNVYTCELTHCPVCHDVLSRCNYRSGNKRVQTLAGVYKILYQPRYCVNPNCEAYHHALRSSEWLQIAPHGGTYGYDVIATIGWRRQKYCRTFEELYAELQGQVLISESQVRYLYQHHYLPLLACHERQHIEQLQKISDTSGLLLTLDGLAPEGGEAQLWLIRELRTGLTIRSGWMSQQDQTAFENFLSPIAESGLTVSVVLSDKQRGLLPAVTQVFPTAKHAFCQSHYLKNLAEPIAELDNTMKMTLRKTVRKTLGTTIRAEHADAPGVLTVTGVLPSVVDGEMSCTGSTTPEAPCVSDLAQKKARVGRRRSRGDRDGHPAKNQISVDVERPSAFQTRGD
jgi:hypothetical protein